MHLDQKLGELLKKEKWCGRYNVLADCMFVKRNRAEGYLRVLKKRKGRHRDDGELLQKLRSSSLWLRG